MRKLLVVLFIFLGSSQSYSQEVSGSFIRNQGVNVPFHIHTMNSIMHGVKRQNFTVFNLSFEDLAGNTTYTGFALYAQALTAEVEGVNNNFPLKRVKLTCTGNESTNVTYVSDTSLVNSKLTGNMVPICYWQTTEGVSRSDVVRISYYIEPLAGFESDNFFVEIDFTLRSYTGTP